jgi:hypothetical protein
MTQDQTAGIVVGAVLVILLLLCLYQEWNGRMNNRPHNCKAIRRDDVFNRCGCGEDKRPKRRKDGVR